MNETVSVIIPAYNEEERITQTLLETIKVLKSLKGMDHEIIIVDDGSTDRTYAALKKFQNEFGEIQIVSYQPNTGKGNALKRGALKASGDYILFMDADLDLHPAHIKDFLKLMKASAADAVIGSKTIEGSEVTVSFKRKFLSKGYYYLIKFLFKLPVTDTQTGFKLFKSRPLKDCIARALVEKYAFDLELLVIMNSKDCKIVESPVHISGPRLSRIRARDVFSVFWDTMAIFRRFYLNRSYA